MTDNAEKKSDDCMMKCPDCSHQMNVCRSQGSVPLGILFARAVGNSCADNRIRKKIVREPK
jgi:C4-type Zn-finger protein